MGQKKHRELFFAYNGVGPWPCFFCNLLVSFDDVVVHHRDHNHGNNEPSNLTPAHGSCHSRDPERNERIGVKQTEYWAGLTPKQRRAEMIRRGRIEPVVAQKEGTE